MAPFDGDAAFELKTVQWLEGADEPEESDSSRRAHRRSARIAKRRVPA
jgi:hypothetical protein